MSDAIELRGVSYRVGDFALEDVSLTVPRGSVYGFLGPNGSGKTTTMRIVMGMAPAGSGTVRVLDAPVPAAMPRILARTGYVPERSHLYDQLTVAEAMRHHAAFFAGWDGAMAEVLRRQFRLRPDQGCRACPRARRASS